MNIRIVCRALTLMSLFSACAAPADAVERTVIYVPEVHLFGPQDAARVGLAGYFAERQFKHRMSEQTRALNDLLGGGADVERDLLREIACPNASGMDRCSNLVVVPEAALDGYLKTNAQDNDIVVRIGAAGIYKSNYQISVVAAPAHAARSDQRINAYYVDWDATADSVRADYEASVHEIKAMLDAGMPVVLHSFDSGLPPEWDGSPRLNTFRQKGANRCVKNAVGNRVLKDGQTRVWLGSANNFGLTISSAKWVLCR